MKTCELKFPLDSCWVLWKKCFWIKTSDPSLSLTLMLKIQLWLKPLSLMFGKALQKKTLIGWIPALEVFHQILKTVRNVFGVQAKAICGLKPGAPALGFYPLCSILYEKDARHEINEFLVCHRLGGWISMVWRSIKCLINREHGVSNPKPWGMSTFEFSKMGPG